MKQIFLISFFSLLCFFLYSEGEKGVILNKMKGNEGKRWAICIGINTYMDDSISTLKKAQNDAKNLGKIFKTRGQFDHVFVMTDDLDFMDSLFPVKANIEEKIEYLLEFVDKNDMVVISFSGHGISDNKGNGYLLAVDTRMSNKLETSVRVESIVNKFKAKGLKKTLLLLDACREELLEVKGAGNEGLKAKIFSSAEVAAIFYATKSGWYSYEDPESDNGVFTRYLLKGMQGDADTSADGVVSFSELEQYVQEKVMEWSLRNGKKQKPYTKIHGEKFGDLGLTAVITNVIEDNEPEKHDPLLEEETIVLIKAGKFMMGGTDTYAASDEKPPHTVIVTCDFYMSKYEVTFDDYDLFCEQADYDKPSDMGWSRGKRPVINVSFYDAIEYCNWLSEKQGFQSCYTWKNGKVMCDFLKNGYRLPTEAEWEYAARGGDKTKGYLYAGRGKPDSVAWYSNNAGEKTHPVGEKRPNEIGLYDMSGNIWEWCWDWNSEYKSQEQTDPVGPDSGKYRVHRGGCWYVSARYNRVSARGKGKPDDYWATVGFRIVRTIVRTTDEAIYKKDHSPGLGSSLLVEWMTLKKGP